MPPLAPASSCDGDGRAPATGGLLGCEAMPRPSNPEDAMRGFLSGEDPGLARMRRVMRRLPHGPNCKLCAAPFEGPAGAVLRHVGFARYPGNPAICGSCIKSLNKFGVFGAEIPVSLLFA